MCVGRLCGYRSMRQLLLTECQLTATHETVRNIREQLDPMSVFYRRHHRLMQRTYVALIIVGMLMATTNLFHTVLV